MQYSSSTKSTTEEIHLTSNYHSLATSYRTKKEEKMASTTTTNTTLQVQNMSTIEQFVPVGEASLVDDAPGWDGSKDSGRQILFGSNNNNDDNNNNSSTTVMEEGPTCWKCKGSGLGRRQKKKRRRKETSTKNDDDNTADRSDSFKQSPNHQQQQRQQKQQSKECCSVCQGKGYLPPKVRERKALQNCPGEITRARTASSSSSSSSSLLL